MEKFRAKIQKPEYRMSATLAGRSAEEIVERLKNLNATVSQLVEEILKLGEREGIRAFDIDMRELTEWIAEASKETAIAKVAMDAALMNFLRGVKNFKGVRKFF